MAGNMNKAVTQGWHWGKWQLVSQRIHTLISPQPNHLCRNMKYSITPLVVIAAVAALAAASNTNPNARQTSLQGLPASVEFGLREYVKEVSARVAIGRSDVANACVLPINNERETHLASGMSGFIITYEPHTPFQLSSINGDNISATVRRLLTCEGAFQSVGVLRLLYSSHLVWYNGELHFKDFSMATIDARHAPKPLYGRLFYVLQDICRQVGPSRQDACMQVVMAMSGATFETLLRHPFVKIADTKGP